MKKLIGDKKMDALNHGKTTRRIVDELMSGKSPEILKVAALYHDIERDYPNKVNTKNCRAEDYLVRKMLHSMNSVKTFIKHFANNYDENMVEDITFLISRHEIGGDKDENGELIYKTDETGKYNLNELAEILLWADKLTFFEIEIEEYSKRGPEKLRNKIIFSLENLPEKIRKKIFNKNYGPEINKIIHDIKITKYTISQK